jgi:hypothetical protein
MTVKVRILTELPLVREGAKMRWWVIDRIILP